MLSKKEIKKFFGRIPLFPSDPLYDRDEEDLYMFSRKVSIKRGYLATCKQPHNLYESWAIKSTEEAAINSCSYGSEKSRGTWSYGYGVWFECYDRSWKGHGWWSKTVRNSQGDAMCSFDNY